ncbi:MAG: sterol desaturase family protein [Acidimicrobiaceae bacterium]|nr:sterol desaturase family protein [Acidimicrobiaceae bacterium]
MSLNRGSRWNYTPPLPIRSAPFLHWPLDPGATLRHLARSWGPLTPRVTMLAFALVFWRWLSPSIETTATLSFGWIAAVWARNLSVMLIVAGGVHLWLYRARRQGDELRYDARPLAKNKRIFLFRDQVLDNMALSLGPAVLVWTAAEVLILHGYGRGWLSLASLDSNPVWFIALILIIPWWSVLYFGAGHRLLHIGGAYRKVHSWHHKNVNVGPWSGLAMHPVEHLVLFGDVFLLFLLPSHPIHFYFMVLHHSLGAPLSHTGYDAVILPGGLKFRVGDFHHQLHHRFLECNYGGLESPLDEMLDTFHDGTADGDAHMAARRAALRKATQ